MLFGQFGPEAFFSPGIAVVVVAALLPESRGIFGDELDSVDPLGTLPGINTRDDQP